MPKRRITRGHGAAKKKTQQVEELDPATRRMQLGTLSKLPPEVRMLIFNIYVEHALEDRRKFRHPSLRRDLALRYVNNTLREEVEISVVALAWSVISISPLMFLTPDGNEPPQSDVVDEYPAWLFVRSGDRREVREAIPSTLHHVRHAIIWFTPEGGYWDSMGLQGLSSYKGHMRVNIEQFTGGLCNLQEISFMGTYKRRNYPRFEYESRFELLLVGMEPWLALPNLKTVHLLTVDENHNGKNMEVIVMLHIMRGDDRFRGPPVQEPLNPDEQFDVKMAQCYTFTRVPDGAQRPQSPLEDPDGSLTEYFRTIRSLRE